MDRSFALRNRARDFARAIARFTKDLPKTMVNIEYSKQIIRSAGSIGANYIEANDALGRKDFLMKIRIARREANETTYWLELLDCPDNLETKRESLLDESIQLGKIFSAILRTMRDKKGSS